MEPLIILLRILSCLTIHDDRPMISADAKARNDAVTDPGRRSINWEVEFCKMEIRPIFFQEILFFDFLEESAYVFACQVVKIWEEEIEEQDFFFPK